MATPSRDVSDRAHSLAAGLDGGLGTAAPGCAPPEEGASAMERPDATEAVDMEASDVGPIDVGAIDTAASMDAETVSGGGRQMKSCGASSRASDRACGGGGSGGDAAAARCTWCWR